MQMCSIAIKKAFKTVEMGQDFPVEFSFASVFYEEMKIKYQKFKTDTRLSGQPPKLSLSLSLFLSYRYANSSKLLNNC